MTIKSTLIGLATGLLALLAVGSCSNDGKQAYLQQQVRQTLQDNNLSVWRVDTLTVTGRNEEGHEDHSATHYLFDVALLLQEDLQRVRYADADTRELVVTAGARAGERAVLPGVAKIEGEQTGLFDKDDVIQARISLPLTDLPAGLPVSLLRQRFADWQQITVGSDAYQSLLNRLRRLLLDEQRALIDVSDRLRRARQQLSVQDEELRELEERAQQSSEMGEPMERASEGIEALMARVDQLQVEQYSQEEAVEKLRADLDHLQGVP